MECSLRYKMRTISDTPPTLDSILSQDNVTKITVLSGWFIISRIFQAASSATARQGVTRFCNVLSHSPCLSRLLGTSVELSRTSIG